MTNWIIVIAAILIGIVAFYSLLSYIKEKRIEWFSFRRKK
ncbi:small membrane protein [Klebsiella pneumoniae]|nr:small membrane protein [Klebsiella pneumoniae]